MCSHDNPHSVFFLDEITKMEKVGTGGIADNQSCREVDNPGAVLLHFRRRIFHVAPGATSTCCVDDELDGCVAVHAESALTVGAMIMLSATISMKCSARRSPTPGSMESSRLGQPNA
jgi:hypothetical protein